MDKFVRSFALIIAIANSATPIGLIAIALCLTLVLASILAMVVIRII